MTGRHQSIPLGDIRTHSTLQNRNTTASMRRRREAEQRAAHVQRLAQNIEINGLQRPLELVDMTADEVAKTGQRFWLVGGHHRLEAMKLLGWKEAPAVSLEGQGLQAARKLSYLQNAELFRQLEDDQRIDNAWRAINDPSFDTFRSMTNKELAATFNVTTRTIDRMRELCRRWAAREQDIDYETERSKAKEQGQRVIRAFNQELDNYCEQKRMGLFVWDFGRLKKELGRGTTEAAIEQRHLITRTVPMLIQAVSGAGLHDIAPMRAALLQAAEILEKSKTYQEACELADARYFDAPSATQERYIRSLEVAPMLQNIMDPAEEADF